MIDQEARSSATRAGEPDRREIISAFSDVLEVISRSMVQVFARQLAPEGITVLQYHALRAISTFGPDMDMSSISAVTGLPASSVTSIVDRLHERGLVDRQHDRADRRRVVATTTEDGAALMQRIREQDLDRLELLLANSSAEELSVCLNVFRDVDERLHELFDTDRPS